MRHDDADNMGENTPQYNNDSDDDPDSDENVYN